MIYIVIVNWNGWADTIECLESVYRLTYKAFKVIVCDNGSTDKSVEYLQMWAEGKLNIFLPQKDRLRSISFSGEKAAISYLRLHSETVHLTNIAENDPANLIIIQNEKNLGFAGANNVGLQYALKDSRLSFVWLLNNDTVVDRDALSHLLRRMAQNPEAGICGSKLLYYGKPDRVQAYGGCTYNAWFGTVHPIGSFSHCSDNVDSSFVESKMDYVIGASMFVTKCFLQQIGLMSEDYFLYFEEIDWALRGKSHFSLVYANDSCVFHKEGRSIGSNCNPLIKSYTADFYNIRNRLRFTRKFFPSRVGVVYFSFIGVLINRILRKQWDRVSMIFSIVRQELLKENCEIAVKPAGITINLSMLGNSHTGLGVYAEHCARYLESRFACTVVSSHYRPLSRTHHVASPAGVAIGSNRWASFRRILYSLVWRCIPEQLVYTPTHHGIFRSNNQIVTVLDLISIRHPRQYPFQFFYFKYILPKIIKRCRAIFTISQSAKNDIINQYKIPAGSVFIIPCGLDLEFFTPPTSKKIAKDYLLVVGASYRHKNIEELLENRQYWKGKYTVVIASCSGKHRLELESLVSHYGLNSDVQFLGYVSSADLLGLYQNCAALVFPSLWEGFGMPPLEAMACGRPVIVSDIEVHKEVMDDVPIYITPGAKESWRQAFTLLEDEMVVAKKVEQGLKLVQEFSWERSGEILFRSLLTVAPELRTVTDVSCRSNGVED